MDNVLIVGAGPTGLTLAIDLRRRGVAVAVTGGGGDRELAGAGAVNRDASVMQINDAFGNC